MKIADFAEKQLYSSSNTAQPIQYSSSVQHLFHAVAARYGGKYCRYAPCARWVSKRNTGDGQDALLEDK